MSPTTSNSRSARRVIATSWLALLLALVAFPLLVEGGSLAHIHKSYEPGIFNEEHVLAALAAVKADAPVSAIPPIVIPLLVAILPLAAAPGPVPNRSAGHPDSRAPPAL